MVGLLGYVLSWILDRTIPIVHWAWGNWGCFLASILVVGVLVWFIPAYVLGWSGGDWKTWFVVGPLATIVVVVMVTSTYGLARRPRPQSHEQGTGQRPDDLESEPAPKVPMAVVIGAVTAALPGIVVLLLAVYSFTTGSRTDTGLLGFVGFALLAAGAVAGAGFGGALGVVGTDMGMRVKGERGATAGAVVGGFVGGAVVVAVVAVIVVWDIFVAGR